MQQRWDPWVKVQTGLAPPRRSMPLSGPAPLRTTVVPQTYDAQKGVRSLLIGLAFAAVAGFHGYRRNSSVIWALIWAAGGFVCPIVTIPIAIHQGFGKKKG
jgi:hypothetical protein